MSKTQAAVPAIVIRRTYNAPRQRVFAAWTDPELLRQWFGPPGYPCVGAQIDLREGGPYRITMLSEEDGVERTCYGTFSEVRAPERLAYSFRWEEDDPSQEYETFVAIEFVDRDGSTEMVFSHDGFPSAESRRRHDVGWSASTEQLRALF